MEKLKTKDEIRDWIDSHPVFSFSKYYINDDLTVDAHYAFIADARIDHLPIQLRYIETFVDARYSFFKSLKGFPIVVGEEVKASYGKSIESFEGAPLYVGGDFNIIDHKLKTFESSVQPEYVGGEFDFSNNTELTSLNGIPKAINQFTGMDTPLISKEEYLRVSRSTHQTHNEEYYPNIPEGVIINNLNFNDLVRIHERKMEIKAMTELADNLVPTLPKKDKSRI